MKQIKLGMLRHIYEDAERNEYKVVEITGLKFVTTYLKYVIQYAEMNKLSDEDTVSFTVEGKQGKLKQKKEEVLENGGANDDVAEGEKADDEATNI